HHVPGWTPGDADAADQSCETVDTRVDDEWSQPAPIGEGVPISAASPTISPNINPQVTNAQGRYGWDVAEGCWFVTVTAEGYQPLTSPVVGVPPAVTDLDLAL